MTLLQKLHFADDFHDVHSSARFATDKDIQQMNFSAEHGVVLGTNLFPSFTSRKTEISSLLMDDSPNNVLLVGPTCSGKHVSTILPTALMWNRSFFCYDPYGLIYSHSNTYREQQYQQKILTFAPESMDKDALHWNPLAEIPYHTANEYSFAKRIAACFISNMFPAAKSLIPVTVERSILFFSLAILYFFYQEQTVPTLPALQKKFQPYLQGESVADFKTCLKKFEQTLSYPDEQEAIAFLKKTIHSEQSVFEAYLPISKCLELFANQPFTETLSSSDFSLKDLASRKDISLYFLPGFQSADASQLLASAFISLFYAFTVSQSQASPFLICLDNMQMLGQIAYLEQDLAISSAKSLLATNSLESLYLIYGKDTAIPATCHVQIYYTPTRTDSQAGQAERELATHISELGGKTLATKFHPHAEPLISPEEFLTMPSDMELIFIAGKPPILAGKFYCHQNPYFEKKMYSFS